MKKLRKGLLPYALLVLGVLLLGYPVVRKHISRNREAIAIGNYYTRLEAMDLAHQWKLAQRYNEHLQKQAPLTQEDYLAAANVSDGVMGILQIPAIAVELPIYHGTGEEVLSRGVGHMPQSAIPIGGEGNHAVLTGHTGFPEAELLTNLVKLQLGDTFSISILGQTLTYRVDQIKIVLPDQGEDLKAVPGEDYCTLVTCTPYRVNSHRLLVRGTRTKEQQ